MQKSPKKNKKTHSQIHKKSIKKIAEKSVSAVIYGLGQKGETGKTKRTAKQSFLKPKFYIIAVLEFYFVKTQSVLGGNFRQFLNRHIADCCNFFRNKIYIGRLV